MGSRARTSTVKVVKSSAERGMLRKDSTQEDLNNRDVDSKMQEDYVARISEE